MDNPSCPVCGGQAQRGSRPLTLTYKDQSVSFEMPGWYCDACEEGIHDGRDMQESDRQLNLLKAQAEGILPPAEVRRIRKRLRLTQEAAGLVLGGGPNAFNKYESGVILPSQAISNLLRVLDSEPSAMSVLIEKLRPLYRAAPHEASAQRATNQKRNKVIKAPV